ncbi:MAG: cytochrome c-type biogenesis protein [Pseudomonadota bacterium]
MIGPRLRGATASLVFAVLASAAAAVQPDEILPDPALEERARALSQELRCLVCRNENIDTSSAAVARDMRLTVRQRLVAGDSDQEVLDFLVARYGEYVLLNPRTDGLNLLLWLAGPLLFLGGGFAAWRVIRRRAGAPLTRPGLSAEEQARLDAILKD